MPQDWSWYPESTLHSLSWNTLAPPPLEGRFLDGFSSVRRVVSGEVISMTGSDAGEDPAVEVEDIASSSLVLNELIVTSLMCLCGGKRG